MKPKKIKEIISLIEYDFDELKLSDFRKIIQNLIEEYGEDAKIINDGHENITYKIEYVRDETEIEMRTRLEKELTKTRKEREKILNKYNELGNKVKEIEISLYK